MHTQANQLVPQLLMKQSNTLFISFFSLKTFSVINHSRIAKLSANLFYFIEYLLRPFTRDSPPTLTPSLSIVWALKFGHCRPNPILFLHKNHAFTIKISASYLEKSLSTSKLLISALEIHWHFVAFNCPPFCLIFSKPTLTVSFGKYRLSIIFSLITS